MIYNEKVKNLKGTYDQIHIKKLNSTQGLFKFALHAHLHVQP